MRLQLLLSLLVVTNVFSQWENVGPAKFTPNSARQSSIESNESGTFVSYIENGKPIVRTFDGEQWNVLGTEDITDFNINNLDMAVFEGTPYLVFNRASTPRNLYVKKFDGENWVDVGTNPIFNGNTQYLTIQLQGDTPYIAFQNTATSKANVIRYTGTTWETVGNADIGIGSTWNIDFKLIDSTPYLSFREFLGVGQNKLNVVRFVDNSWQYVGASVADLALNSDATNPLVNSAIAFEPETKVPYVSYAISNPNPSESYNILVTKKLENNIWVTVGTPIANVLNTFEGPRATFFANQITVAYNGVDPTNTNTKVCVRTFNGTSWETVGSNYFASGGQIDTENFPEDRDYDLASTADFLYLSYSEDSPLDRRLSVRKIASPLSVDIIQQNQLVVAPNPSENLFQISSNDAAINWIVFNNLGQEIQSGFGTQIDLSSQARGIYFLKIYSEKSYKQTIKLVKK